MASGNDACVTNYKIKTLLRNKYVYLVFSAITSRHVSASTCDHLKVISVSKYVSSNFNICNGNHLKMATCRGRNMS
jgi:hypothetical protein